MRRSIFVSASVIIVSSAAMAAHAAPPTGAAAAMGASARGEALEAVPRDAKLASREAMATKLAPLRRDARFIALRQEFEAAAKIQDWDKRAEALKAAVAKGAAIRTSFKDLIESVKPKSEQPRGLLALPIPSFPSSLTIPVSSFKDEAGSKTECPDAEDRFSFPNGDPFVQATSEYFDKDCDRVGATVWGGSFPVAAGTKSFVITAKLDYRVRVAAAGYGANASAASWVVMPAIAHGLKLKGGATIANGDSVLLCRIHGIGIGVGPIEYGQGAETETDREVSCRMTIESGGAGSVDFGFGVTTSVDGNFTGVAFGDGRLKKIRSVSASFER